jgi:hypothetical protein
MIEPDVKWAVYPWDEGKVVYIEALCDSSYTLPNEGDLIVRPCLVDPATRDPILVCVAEIRKYPEMQPPLVVFVVIPANLPN